MHDPCRPDRGRRSPVRPRTLPRAASAARKAHRGRGRGSAVAFHRIGAWSRGIAAIMPVARLRGALAKPGFRCDGLRCDNRRMSEPTRPSPAPPISASATCPSARSRSWSAKCSPRSRGKYDLMNDLMSLGVHRVWKRYFVGTCQVKRGDRVLDLAGGTGDIAALLHERVGDDRHVVLGDINGGDAARGPRPHDRPRHGARPRVRADATPRSCRSRMRSFDLVTIAFGLRNVTDKDAALREMHRVLKVGGQARVLEFSEVKAGVVQADLRLPFVQGAAAPGQAVRQRRRQLPVPGRVDPQASAAGRAEGDDGGGRVRALRLQQPQSAASSRSTPATRCDSSRTLGMQGVRRSVLPMPLRRDGAAVASERASGSAVPAEPLVQSRLGGVRRNHVRMRRRCKLSRATLRAGLSHAPFAPDVVPRRRAGRPCRLQARRRRRPAIPPPRRHCRTAGDRRALLRRARQGQGQRISRWNSKLDFDKKELAGSATCALDWLDQTATQLVLDTRDLTIEKVVGERSDGKWDDAASSRSPPADKVLGSKLTIETPQRNRAACASPTRPRRTPRACSGSTPAMTAGKKTPFMFSQSQQIHARSWVPLQDTPQRALHLHRARAPRRRTRWC